MFLLLSHRSPVSEQLNHEILATLRKLQAEAPGVIFVHSFILLRIVITEVV